MRKLFLVSSAILIAFMLITLAPQVHAQEDPDPSVRTEDLNDNTEDYFEYVGETVRIIAHVHTNYHPYTIKVYDPANTLVKTIGPLSMVDYVGDHTDISTSVGLWRLKLLHTTTEYATGSFFVIPETPLGVATALITCFAGLGITRLRRTRKESY